MDYVAYAALAIFAITVKRPWGIRLGYAAAIGAVASLLVGSVTLSQAAQSFADI